MDLASELVSTAVNEFGEWAYLSVVIGVVVCFDDRICDGALENTSFPGFQKRQFGPIFDRCFRPKLRPNRSNPGGVALIRPY